MKKIAFLTLFSGAVLAACVTINVYFPAAAAERAASEFVEDVLGEPVEDGSIYNPVPDLHGDPRIEPFGSPASISLLAYNLGGGLVSFLVSDAHAQRADIEINTPQINAIKARMAQRQRQTLSALFDSGAIGYTNDGLVAIRDRSAVGLQERRNLESIVAEENRDLKAVYREIAVANGHPEWESDIQQTFAREWINKARPGWYYQDARGNWVTK